MFTKYMLSSSKPENEVTLNSLVLASAPQKGEVRMRNMLEKCTEWNTRNRKARQEEEERK